MDQDISSFIANYGINLSKYGSAETGFTRSEALELLGLLKKQNIKLLGIEVWRQQADGRINIDSLAGWAPEPHADIDVLFAEATNIVMLEGKRPFSFFTLQF